MLTEEFLYPCRMRAVHHPADPAAQAPACFTPAATLAEQRFQRTIPGYAPTPLVPLPGLAARLGVRAVLVKDESARFGLNAFKGMGAVCAVARVICRRLELDFEQVSFQDLTAPAYRAQLADLVFCTATDGNHGKGVAWAAAQFGCGARIYMPAGTVPARVQAIEAWGAQVTVTNLDYDGTVALAAAAAAEHGWTVVQDTAPAGEAEIPTWIARGYCTLAREAVGQMQALDLQPTHVFLQAGVGTFAAAVMAYLAAEYAEDRPLMAVVEADSAACVMESMTTGDGRPHTASPGGSTEMAGLNCATPNPAVWPVLRDLGSVYVACPDWVTEDGMRLLADPAAGDRAIVSGESGAVPAGLLQAVMLREDLRPLRSAMGLNGDSVVLLFSTEGATDPENYRRIVAGTRGAA